VSLRQIAAGLNERGIPAARPEANEMVVGIMAAANGAPCRSSALSIGLFRVTENSETALF
jgi:hypothetical protein